jgi:hypothetical protein
MTFDEDRSQVRCGNIPQVMAALRKTVIGLTRWAGETNIAAASHRFAAQPALALEFIGIQLENCMALAVVPCQLLRRKLNDPAHLLIGISNLL